MKITLRTFRQYFHDAERINASELPEKAGTIFQIFNRNHVPLDQIHVLEGSQDVVSVVLPKETISARSITNVKRALLEQEHLLTQVVKKHPYWGGEMWELSYVPQIDLGPYIKELRKAGAKDEHIVACKRGFKCFLERKWGDCIPALVSGYKIMLGSKKTTGLHLEVLLYYAIAIKQDKPKGVKAYNAVARVYADYIKQGVTPQLLLLRATNSVAAALEIMDDETYDKVFAVNET